MTAPAAALVPPPVRYRTIRDGVPTATPPIYETRAVARESFGVVGVGGLAVWLGLLIERADEAVSPILLIGLPIWVLACLLTAYVVGHEGSLLRANVWLFRIGGITTAAAVAVASIPTGGLTSPVIVGLFLVTSFQAFVLPTRDALFNVPLSIAFWVAVAVASPDGEANLGILQLPLFGLAWAIGAISHRAYAQATSDAVRLSTTDPVTGCLNRHGVELALDAGLERSKREASDLTLLMLDLDDFKRINDTLGHAAGDDLLAWIGEELRSVLRAGTAVGRLGGDEFVAIMPGTSGEEGPRVAERVTIRLMSRIGASVGWAAAPGEGLTGDDLMRVADGRLYAMKQRRKRGPRGQR